MFRTIIIPIFRNTRLCVTPLVVNEISSLHFELTPIVICNALYWKVMFNPFDGFSLYCIVCIVFFDICIQTWRWPSQVAETCSWYGYLCYRIQLCYDWYILCMIVTLRSTYTTGMTHLNTKLRKAIISFVMSVNLSAWNNSAPTGRIFMKLYIWVFFENLSRKLKYH